MWIYPSIIARGYKVQSEAPPMAQRESSSGTTTANKCAMAHALPQHTLCPWILESVLTSVVPACVDRIYENCIPGARITALASCNWNCPDNSPAHPPRGVYGSGQYTPHGILPLWDRQYRQLTKLVVFCCIRTGNDLLQL